MAEYSDQWCNKQIGITIVTAGECGVQLGGYASIQLHLCNRCDVITRSGTYIKATFTGTDAPDTGTDAPDTAQTIKLVIEIVVPIGSVIVIALVISACCCCPRAAAANQPSQSSDKSVELSVLPSPSTAQTPVTAADPVPSASAPLQSQTEGQTEGHSVRGVIDNDSLAG